MPRGRPKKEQSKSSKLSPKKKSVKQPVEEKTEDVLFQQKFWHEDESIPAWRRWIKKILGI